VEAVSVRVLSDQATLFYWNQSAVFFSHTKLATATAPANQQYFTLKTNQHQPPAAAAIACSFRFLRVNL